MELYRISRKNFKDSIKIARCVSMLTGELFFYHLIDCLLCNLKYGCSPRHYLYGGFYKLRSFERKNTFTKKRIRKVRDKYNDKKFEHVLSNKVEFNQRFSSYISRSWLYCKSSNLVEIKHFIEVTNNVIVKPLNLSKGKGIHILNKDTDVSVLVGKDVILEEFISQRQEMCFGNNSVNTLRVVTIMDSKGVVHVIKAGLRCGIGDAVVDNISSGGVAYPINIEYGFIEGPGGNDTLGYNILYHPGTDIKMIGREIPFWEETISVVKKAAKLIPQVRFVGWDVAITNNGPELIEGNEGAGASIVEFMGLKKGLFKQMMSFD